MAELDSARGVRSVLLPWALDMGRRVFVSRSQGQLPAGLLAAAWDFADWAVLASLRHEMGLDRTRFLVSCAAPLAEQVSLLMGALGLDLVQLYGTAECSGLAAMSVPGAINPGTVGKAPPGSWLKLGEEGEILMRGPQVCLGYWKDDEATQKAFDGEGWLRTGDVGELDEDGLLTITDRLKDVIVLSDGTHVPPSYIATLFQVFSGIGHVVIVGDRRPFAAALITLDLDALPEFCATLGIAQAPLAELAVNAAVQAEVRRIVDAVNERLPSAWQIQRFAILHAELMFERGEINALGKVRRDAVVEHYVGVSERMYQNL